MWDEEFRFWLGKRWEIWYVWVSGGQSSSHFLQTDHAHSGLYPTSYPGPRAAAFPSSVDSQGF